MRERVRWTAADSVPERAEVLSLQGMPPGAGVPPRIAALHDAALAAYLEAAEPRAIVGEISREEFAEVYRGAGRNAAATPLEAVFPRADRLALFTATVGRGLTERIRDLFERNEPALAAMLDSVASAAADRLATLLGPRYLAMAGDAGANGARVLAYSPGYCGWHVSGQRALFAFLEPGEIGVTLNPSCLMEPLKSVSGVLVAGPAGIHRFAPAFPFCAECREKPCRERIAALSGS
ncbi:MAG: hypothetical protein HZC42_11680 [Candidatus Eisenbacteria bacterium]|nr:hypothetical protein [Candidatus Eisenbacteria bacterium]